MSKHTENVEADSLAQRSALANSDLVTLLNTECWADVCSEVLVPLLISGVLGDKVEVLAADDECAVHLCRDDGTREDTAADGNLTGERALPVCVVPGLLALALFHPVTCLCCYACGPPFQVHALLLYNRVSTSITLPAQQPWRAHTNVGSRDSSLRCLKS